MNSLHLISHRLFVAALDAAARRPGRSARKVVLIPVSSLPDLRTPAPDVVIFLKPSSLPRLAPRSGAV